MLQTRVTMNLPLQITYRDIDPSDSLTREIQRRARGLERYFDRITRCRVILMGPSQNHRHGEHYHARIELSVPGQELIAGEHDGGKDDAYAAMRDAFATAERELKKYARRRIEHHQARVAVA